MKKRLFTTFLVFILLFTIAGTAFAAEHDVDPCAGTVTGMVTAVDEEAGTITVVTEDGDECVLTINSDYDHPIVALLGAYFSDVDYDAYAEALDTTTVCAVYDETLETWVVAAEEEETEEVCEGTELTVTGSDGEGGFTAVDGEGEEVSLSFEDEEAAAEVAAALDSLSAEFEVNEDGVVEDTGDQIAEYHEDGYGFGELVKIYAIAAESLEACEAEAEAEEPAAEGEEVPTVEGEEEEACGVTVEELIALLEEGASMGDLFALYGKPSMLGVGHVRQALNSDGTFEATSETSLSSDSGDCKSGLGHQKHDHTKTGHDHSGC